MKKRSLASNVSLVVVLSVLSGGFVENVARAEGPRRTQDDTRVDPRIVELGKKIRRLEKQLDAKDVELNAYTNKHGSKTNPPQGYEHCCPVREVIWVG